MKKTILVELNSVSLGDTIASMPCVDYFRKINNYNVIYKINPEYEFLFQDSYPEIIWYNSELSFDKKIIITYDFNNPIQTGFAKQLGFFEWTYINPKIDFTPENRPIKNKYVTMGIHSTSQLKYWNSEGSRSHQILSSNWNELCSSLRKTGITPVVVDKNDLFGFPPYFNGIPKNANKKIGLPLKETINIIYHSEFYIGPSSGLIWIAHSLGKKIAMISNFTEDWNEMDLKDPNYIRITNKSVCHGCWNKVNKEYKFDPTDWYWCPLHKGTDREFECHKSITPSMVMEKIKMWI
jgi:hypothetical protein